VLFRSNTIGDPELVSVWKDPDFDPAQRAFYYARVIEIPTPRWTAYDLKHFGTKPLPGTMMILQERACTSPIWYTPQPAEDKSGPAGTTIDQKPAATMVDQKPVGTPADQKPAGTTTDTKKDEKKQIKKTK
jgi:hypothetical protein